MGIKNLFKKKREEVLDLSDLQKRGIYNPKEKKATSEIMDLSNTQPTPTEESTPFDFLGTMATSQNNQESTSEVSSVRGERKQRLKTVISDIKSELKHHGDKVYKLSDRLDLIEKKLDRIERRVGL